MRTFLLLAAVAIGLHAVHGYVATPLIGFQQGVTVQISPADSTNQQCNVYGVPTPYGYAATAPGPLFFYTPQNSGAHTIQFAFNRQQYNIFPFLAPGNTRLQIDASNQTNPLITFDASNSPLGQSGAVTIYLVDARSGATYCSLQIQLAVDPPLSCAPNYGGVYGFGGGSTVGVPSGAGNFVIPSGTVYAPTYVNQVIIQQFTTVNNINIQNVVVNVNQITNTTVINNIIINNPPSPAPVNCTATPTNAACARTPTGNTTVAPSRGPGVAPAVAPARTTPVTAPPTANPPAVIPPASNTNLGLVPPTAARTPTPAQTTQSTTSVPSGGPSSGLGSSG